VLEKFTTLLNNKAQEICFEELLELFEFVISPSDKLNYNFRFNDAILRNLIISKKGAITGASAMMNAKPRSCNQARECVLYTVLAELMSNTDANAKKVSIIKLQMFILWLYFVNT
jgi:hypothetical protein